MKRQKKLMACLTAGVLILAVSATAAFGSVNGYSAYKDAVVVLAFEEENFTGHATLSAQLDGMDLLDLELDYAQDGPNRARVVSGQEDGETRTEYDTTLDGVNTWFQEDWNFYYQRDGVENYPNFMDAETDHEMYDRMINFCSIAADTVVGELKNNVVQIGSEDGKDIYQVNISNAQVPALVNAGLSLLAYEMGGWDGQINTVEYENYVESMFTYYEATTGEVLPEDFKAGYRGGYTSQWYEANQALVDTFEQATDGMMSEFSEKYYGMLEDKGGAGVIYVNADNSYDYYATAAEYLAAHPAEAQDVLSYFMAEDLVLENIACTFALDDQGRIAATDLAVEFLTTDPEGGRHTLTFTGDVTITGYGSTTIQPLDTGDRVKSE